MLTSFANCQKVSNELYGEKELDKGLWWVGCGSIKGKITIACTSKHPSFFCWTKNELVNWMDYIGMLGSRPDWEKSRWYVANKWWKWEEEKKFFFKKKTVFSMHKKTYLLSGYIWFHIIIYYIMIIHFSLHFKTQTNNLVIKIQTVPIILF